MAYNYLRSMSYQHILSFMPFDISIRVIQIRNPLLHCNTLRSVHSATLNRLVLFTFIKQSGIFVKVHTTQNCKFWIALLRMSLVFVMFNENAKRWHSWKSVHPIIALSASLNNLRLEKQLMCVFMWIDIKYFNVCIGK